MLASPMLVDERRDSSLPAYFSSRRGREESLCSSPSPVQHAVYRSVDVRGWCLQATAVVRRAVLSSISDTMPVEDRDGSALV